MKDVLMFSTIDGAKKRAKALKKLLDDSGFAFSLRKCQEAVARAGGYRDWHDLLGALGRGGRGRRAEPEVYERRLLAVLPDPCRPPVVAWLDGEPAEEAPDSLYPPRWFHDAFHFVFASAILHRSRTAVLRPGSGEGQRFREKLVVGLLSNQYPRPGIVPRLEPDTLAVLYPGSLAEIYGKDAGHPRFELEIRTLAEAGVLEVLPNALRVLPPDVDAVRDHVLNGWIGKTEHWIDEGPKEATSALREALAAIGVRNALRVTEAIIRFGSDAYITPSGPALDLLTKLAEEGEIEIFSKVFRLFAGIRPQNAEFMRSLVPAKITSGYLARHRGLSLRKFTAFSAAHPDWAQTLKSSVDEPVRFARTVDAMAAAVAEAAG
jgi:hypothetical protein